LPKKTTGPNRDFLNRRVSKQDFPGMLGRQELTSIFLKRLSFIKALDFITGERAFLSKGAFPFLFAVPEGTGLTFFLNYLKI
jgi:hypothetical protein